MKKDNGEIFLFFFIVVAFYNIVLSFASQGDASPIFSNCISSCHIRFNCPASLTSYAWVKQTCFRYFIIIVLIYFFD